MKRIIFIRHAKVDMDSNKPIYARSLKKWEEAYNSAPISNVLPEPALIQSIRDADYVICSTRRRTIDSLALLEVRIDEQNSMFNEAEIPLLKGAVIKLKPTHWLILFRLLSLLGVGRWARTLKETKENASVASGRLLELTSEYDNIILMGHGVMNWLIRKELRKYGWKNEGNEGHGNWGSTILFYDINE